MTRTALEASLNFYVQDLLPLFEKYGDVGDIYLPVERGSGRSRGFAFVRYYDKRDAEVNIYLKLNASAENNLTLSNSKDL